MIGSKDNWQAAMLAVPMELAKISTDMQRGLAEFANGQRIDAARAVDVARRPLVWGGSGRLVGWSLRAVGTAGQVATFTLRDGRDVSADQLGTVTLTVGQGGGTAWFGPTGIHFGEALYLDVDATSTAALVGAVWLGAVD